MPSVGGSFRVMQAASRIGAATKHAGVIGNGPWASLIRKALNDNGIEHIGQDRIDADSGFRLVLNDSERKTFVATYGAESQGNENTFDCVEPGEGDVAHISANTLMDHSASGIDAFLHRTSSDPTTRDYSIVLNPTNTLHMVSDHLLEDLVLVRPIWSCNRQEARTLADRLGVFVDDSLSMTVGGGVRRLDEGAVQQPRRHAARAAGGSCGVARRVGAHAGRRSHPCGGVSDEGDAHPFGGLVPHRCHVRTDRPRLVACRCGEDRQRGRFAGHSAFHQRRSGLPGYDEVIAKLEEDETPAEAAK